MYLLSLESSTQHFGLAVSKDGRVLRARTLKVNRLLENSIIRAIDRILAAAGVSFEQLDGFVVGLGPGSFTSLRIGLSTVKAFALATQKPLAGIGSLDVIAAGVSAAACDQICVIVDARRNLLYSTLYRKGTHGWAPAGPPVLTPLASILDNVKGTTLFVGDGVGLYRQAIEQAYQYSKGSCTALFAPEKSWRPQPHVLAELGHRRLVSGQKDDPAALLPIYLYAQDCQVSTTKKSDVKDARQKHT